MVRDSRYRLVTYHGTGLGEMFDLRADPSEFDNRWHDPALPGGPARPAAAEASTPLALATDLGPPQTANYLTIVVGGRTRFVISVDFVDPAVPGGSVYG